MDLSDALGDWPNNQSAGGGTWPGQPSNNPTWPGQPANPTWPGGQPSNPTWPGAPPQPSGPGGWPAGPAGPAAPSGPGGWPAGPAGPAAPSGPGWPSAPSQPANPAWPAAPSGPGGWPSGPAPGPVPSPSFPVAPQTNLSVPFKQQFPSGLRDKTLISIAGTVKPNPNRFNIDFHTASDVAFHFNPRFNEEGKQVIVRNSYIGNKWGTEERELSHFPFKPGQSFEIKILVTKSSFKVAVNDSHLLEFKHRIPNIGAISHMTINVDVALSKFNVENVP